MAFSDFANNSAVTRTAAALATVFGLSACAPLTISKTAGMSRSPVVEGEAMSVAVKMDPCMRAGIDVVHIYDTTPEDIASKMNNGDRVSYHRSVYLIQPKDATPGLGKAFGAILGGVVGYYGGKAIGVNPIAGGVAGGIGGAGAGDVYDKEAHVASLVEKRACTQFLDSVFVGLKEKNANFPTDVAPYKIRNISSDRHLEQRRRISPQIIWTR